LLDGIYSSGIQSVSESEDVSSEDSNASSVVDQPYESSSCIIDQPQMDTSLHYNPTPEQPSFRFPEISGTLSSSGYSGFSVVSFDPSENQGHSFTSSPVHTTFISSSSSSSFSTTTTTTSVETGQKLQEGAFTKDISQNLFNKLWNCVRSFFFRWLWPESSTTEKTEDNTDLTSPNSEEDHNCIRQFALRASIAGTAVVMLALVLRRTASTFCDPKEVGRLLIVATMDHIFHPFKAT
jgi:hypothetical protein